MSDEDGYQYKVKVHYRLASSPVAVVSMKDMDEVLARFTPLVTWVDSEQTVHAYLGTIEAAEEPANSQEDDDEQP